MGDFSDAPSLRESPAPRSDQPPVFVFGSNLAGRHGRGAALWANQHRGAVYGVGEGRTGQSYALPTKGHRLETLSLAQIRGRSVHNFLAYARAHPELTFQLTPIGCGLAGYLPAEIAPMFAAATPNVLLPGEFMAVLKPADGPSNRKDGSSPQNNDPSDLLIEHKRRAF